MTDSNFKSTYFYAFFLNRHDQDWHMEFVCLKRPPSRMLGAFMAPKVMKGGAFQSLQILYNVETMSNLKGLMLLLENYI